MQWAPPKVQIEVNADRYAEFRCAEATKARFMLQQTTVEWAAVAWEFQGSTSDTGEVFFLITGAPTPSNDGMTDEFNIGNIRRIRAVITSAGMADQGSIGNVHACFSNPELPEGPPRWFQAQGRARI